MKPRILVVVTSFPQVSQTYIKVELEALRRAYDVYVASLVPPDLSYATDQPHERADGIRRLIEIVRAFRPHVLHTHWLRNAATLHWVAERTGVPFTIRGHSFDVLEPRGGRGVVPALKHRIKHLARGRLAYAPSYVDESVRYVNGKYCLGLLAFPFARPRLTALGMRDDRIVDCYPVIDFERFHDRSPNGPGVMNVGAASPKKKMADFIDLASRFDDRPFNIYAMGYQSARLAEYNRRAGSPARVMEAVHPDRMPAEYKRHQWLVYTGEPAINTVGWPLAVAEAQAAGTGVCMANLRPDLAEFVGGAGYLFDSIDEVSRIIAEPPPEVMRERGFEQARKSDIHAHLHRLTGLWAPCLPENPAA